MEERPNGTEERTATGKRTEVEGLSVEELEGLGGSLLPDRIEMRRRRRRRRRSGGSSCGGVITVGCGIDIL